jgi:hypothetical protein
MLENPIILNFCGQGQV